MSRSNSNQSASSPGSPNSPSSAERGGGARLVPPQLLSPAGNWECLRAAVENGADAVYFGVDRFNARMRAANFPLVDISRVMEFLHERGVKGYVTFNTLVFTEEMAEAAACLRQIIESGVDAAIVQDLGVCRLIRRISPDFPIHASTQMTVSSLAGVEFVRDLGCSMVALARECSLTDIEKIQSGWTGTRGGVPLEIFVHGALCVAYSGQCLTSESFGGRSANRGVCAQACRLPYELICDGQRRDLGDRRYLLSPQDLAGVELLPEILKAGVHTIKIEGRLKSPAYVASITRIYRQALDDLARQTLSERSVALPRRLLSDTARYEMEMAFSRGLYTGWLGGIDNQRLVHGRFGKKRGVLLGEVRAIEGENIVVRLCQHLKPGDGVVFDAGHPDKPEQGGRVYEVRRLGAAHQISFGRGDVDRTQIHVGDRLWKTDDPELARSIKRSYSAPGPQFQRPVNLVVGGEEGMPLTVEATDEQGNSVRVLSQIPLVAARNQPLDAALLRKHLGRLGDTPFRLGELCFQVGGRVILPVSELNRLRREWTEALIRERKSAVRWTVIPSMSSGSLSGMDPGQLGRNAVDTRSHGPVELVVLVRSEAQLESALMAGVRDIYCELEDLRRYRDAAQRVRRHRETSPMPEATGSPRLWVAPPRITKPGETWMLQQVRDSGADGFLARNYDHLRFFSDAQTIADSTLNIANPLSAEYLMGEFGIHRLTASYDLNGPQLGRLMASACPEWFEVTIHQHMPMFHMDHCVFCAFLSSGTDFSNCGCPCEKHGVKLRDRVGVEHPVKADAGCRNTVFNGLVQTGAEEVPRLLAAGVRVFRLDFLDESPDMVRRTIEKYRQLLRGEITGTALWRQLRLMSFMGVTRGPRDRTSD